MSEETNVRPTFDQWAIVELMGHVRMTGRLTEVEHFGSKLGKLDVIDKDGAVIATQYFGGASVYRITNCTEETAKSMAKRPSDAGPEVSWDVHEALRSEYEQRYRERVKQIETRPHDGGDDHIEDDNYPI